MPKRKSLPVSEGAPVLVQSPREVLGPLCLHQHHVESRGDFWVRQASTVRKVAVLSPGVSETDALFKISTTCVRSSVSHPNSWNIADTARVGVCKLSPSLLRKSKIIFIVWGERENGSVWPPLQRYGSETRFWVSLARPDVLMSVSCVCFVEKTVWYVYATCVLL